jgi:membrane associated rhomboid family serine protease
MNQPIEYLALGLMLVTLVFSYQGFASQSFLHRFAFEVGPVRFGKEYLRLFSSGFLHVNWTHLILNMYALYAFARVLDRPIARNPQEPYGADGLLLDPTLGLGSPMGAGAFLLLYLLGLLGGNLLALYLHRYHEDYRAVGASGAVSAVVFAAIVLYPDLQLSFILLPVSFPGWAFGLGYTLFTLYGIRSQKGNIGHEAHLGGMLVGLVFAMLYAPWVVPEHPWVIVGIMLPIATFLYLMVYFPQWRLVPGYASKHAARFAKAFSFTQSSGHPSRKAPDFASKEEELNHLLDKGLKNLSNKERRRLEALSRELDG